MTQRSMKIAELLSRACRSGAGRRRIRREKIAALAQPGKLGRKIDEALRDHVDHQAGALQAAAHREKACRS